MTPALAIAICYIRFAMRRRPLGNTSIEVTELSLGTWGLSGDGYGPVSELDQDRVIERALALGINLFDTADCYAQGAMERRLGARIGSETGAVVVTKIGTDRTETPPRKRFDRPYLERAVATSAERLKRSRLDIVLLHNPSLMALERGETTGWLAERVSKGEIATWGVSVSDAECGRVAIAHGARVVALAHNAFHRATLNSLAGAVRDSNVGVLAHSVLAYGLLCGLWPHDKTFGADDHRSERWTRDELRARQQQLNALRPSVAGPVTTLRSAALRFVLSSEFVSSAVLGPRSTLQLDQLVREAGREPPYLPPERLAALEARLTGVGVAG